MFTGKTTSMFAFAALVAVLGACEDDPPKICETCPGVTKPVICEETFCTAGVTCSKTWYVTSATSSGGDGSQGKPFSTLGAAAKVALSGHCIALSAGSYAGTMVAGGVSVLGTGAADVQSNKGRRTVIAAPPGSVALAATKGKGGIIRGVALIADDSVALAIDEVDGLTVTQVRVEGAVGVGVDARRATNLTLEHVTVRDVTKAQASPTDAGVDLPSVDLGAPDLGAPDLGAPDLGAPDLVAPDLGAPEAGVPDSAADAGLSTDAIPGVDAGAPAPDSAPAPDAAPVPDSAPAVDSAAAKEAGTTPDAGSGTQEETGAGIGVLLAVKSSAEVISCEVTNCETQGVLIHGSKVTLRKSKVTGSQYFGLALDCSGGCSNGGSTLVDNEITKNKGIGLLVIGGTHTIKDNRVEEVSFGEGWQTGVLLHKVTLTFSGNTIRKSAGQGLLVDACSGTVNNNTVSSNADRGVWIQNVSKGLLFDGNTIDANDHVGLGVLDSDAVTIKGGSVTNTKERMIPSGPNSEWVGDGLQVSQSGASQKIQIQGVELKNNERVGLAITTSSVTTNKVVVSGSKFDLIAQKGSSAVVVEKPDGTQTKPANKTEWVSTMPIPLPAPKWDFLKQAP